MKPLLQRMNLSDIDTVKFLLMSRYLIDRYYKEVQNNNWNEAGVIGEVNEDLIALYVSLEELINEIAMTKKETEVLDLYELGYTYADIGKMTNRGRQAVFNTIDRLAKRIVDKNNCKWRDNVKGYVDNG